MLNPLPSSETTPNGSSSGSSAFRRCLVWLDRTQRIAQRRVGQSPPNTQQPPRRLAHPLAQILDLGEALGARDHGSEGRAQQRPEPPVPLRVSRSASFAPVVAGVVNFVETELIESDAADFRA